MIFHYGDGRLKMHQKQVHIHFHKIKQSIQITFLQFPVRDFTFALNNSGEETVTLIAPNNDIIDTAHYKKTVESVSLGRKSQSSKELFPTKKQTPNAKNIFEAVSKESDINDEIITGKPYLPLILSELLPSPLRGKSEYIEIYNPNSIPILLNGWVLRDGSKNGSYTFSKNSQIDPGEFYTIYRDVYKFALNNSGGETVSLVDPNGKEVATTSYATASKGASYGWTGASWRFSPTQTPNAKNIFGTRDHHIGD